MRSSRAIATGRLRDGINGGDRPGHALEVDQSCGQTAAKRWRMTLDPRQASIMEAIGTGICIGLVGYLAYVLFSYLATA